MTFWRNYYHLVWATKDRLALIRSDFEAELFHYIVSKARELEVIVYVINGTENHVHAVVAIPPKYSVAEVVKHIKGSSAHYINSKINPGENFKWQRGYGCLTLGEKQRPIAEAYVQNQKSHHDQNSTNAWLENIEVENGWVNGKSIREEFSVYNSDRDLPF
jgi:REP element-mobilizing transposase RayT